MYRCDLTICTFYWLLTSQMCHPKLWTSVFELMRVNWNVYSGFACKSDPQKIHSNKVRLSLITANTCISFILLLSSEFDVSINIFLLSKLNICQELNIRNDYDLDIFFCWFLHEYLRSIDSVFICDWRTIFNKSVGTHSDNRYQCKINKRSKFSCIFDDHE